MSWTEIEIPARMACLKPGLHQMVGKKNGLLVASQAVAMVDQLGQVLLAQHFVVGAERNFVRNDLGKKRATDGGVADLAVDAALDLASEDPTMPVSKAK